MNLPWWSVFCMTSASSFPLGSYIFAFLSVYYVWGWSSFSRGPNDFWPLDSYSKSFPVYTRLHCSLISQRKYALYPQCHCLSLVQLCYVLQSSGISWRLYLQASVLLWKVPFRNGHLSVSNHAAVAFWILLTLRDLEDSWIEVLQQGVTRFLHVILDPSSKVPKPHQAGSLCRRHTPMHANSGSWDRCRNHVNRIK